MDLVKFTAKRVIQKLAEATDLISNKIAGKIRKVLRTSEIVINEIENIQFIPKERCISPEKRQEVIDELEQEIIDED